MPYHATADGRSPELAWVQADPWSHVPQDQRRFYINPPADEAEDDEDDEEPAVCADDEHDWQPAGHVTGDVECAHCGVQDSTYVAPAWADDVRW